MAECGRGSVIAHPASDSFCSKLSLNTAMISDCFTRAFARHLGEQPPQLGSDLFPGFDPARHHCPL